ncbi:Kinesin light chain 3 [Physocladia obscura]|uniref:Kinesin light chain 3 n=1 Tax=Physocladia obscura TaxID=109957 RepID=A0AAD5SSZ6_9FUNG|nr:Kinesin light chain 3 [Physocladia obscura]
MDNDDGTANALSIKGLPFAHFHELIEAWGGRDAVRGLSTADVCARFVQPATRGSGLSLCAQYSRLATPPAAPADAAWFVSHAWKLGFLDLVDALDHFFRRRRRLHSLDAQPQIVWFDLFSNSQHNTQAKPLDWWERTFMNAVKKIGNVVMVMLPCSNPVPLTRAWCIFEVYATVLTGSNFHIALPSAESETFLNELRLDSSRYHSLLAKVSCKRSDAINPSDKKAIFDLVQKSVGFVKLDRMVFETISSWITARLEHSVQETEKESGPEYYDWVYAAGNFRYLYLCGQYDTAEPLLTESVNGRRQLLGRNHPDTLKSLNCLARLYESNGKYPESERILLECLKVCETTLSPSHPDTLTAINNLATLYRSQGRYAESKELAIKCFETSENTLGLKHPDTLRNMKNLALLYYYIQRYDDAEPLNEQCYQYRKETLGEDHPDTLSSLSDLAMLYLAQRRMSEAEAQLSMCLTMREGMLGEAHPDTTMSMNNLALFYSSQMQIAEAEALFYRCLELRKASIGAAHPSTLTTMRLFAILYQNEGKYEKAEELMQECLEGCKKTLGKKHLKTVDAVLNLAKLWRIQGKYFDAKNLCVKELGELHPQTVAFVHKYEHFYKNLEE